MYKTYEMNLAGRPFKVEIGRVAELAGGAALVYYGGTVVLVAATASEKPRAGIDYFPLGIDYEEKLYAVGKIPGGFIKREGRPSEKAVLTARLIDRPIRPLFPEDYRNDVAVVATVMSVDQDCSPEVAAMIGASLALSISDIPFQGPTGSVSVGLVDDKLVINPTAEQREKSKLVLTVASTEQKVMMIEAGADEVPEDIMMRAIMLAHEENKRIVAFINNIVAEVGKAKHSYQEYSIPEEFYSKVREFITDKRMEDAVFSEVKQKREEELTVITDEVNEKLIPSFDEEVRDEYAALVGDAIYKFEKETVRRMILRDHKRPDGRGINEIRKLSSEVDILPMTHGSALFSRGQTQVLTVTTLGSMGEVQRLDGLDDQEEQKRYMHHYNFPSYSVGETRPSRGPGRREIGHGALAERALLPVLPSEDDFPYAIRTVSEVLSSNGSTSQGAVCGSTLSLMAAGVPIKRPVAGISVGLLTGESDSDYVLIDDIQGIEDFFGDMDFKVAGTTEGITAIQVDMKIHGLTEEMIREALEHTRITRLRILDENMLKTIAEPRAMLSPHAPKIGIVKIDPDKLAEVIGSRGKVIKRIIEDSGVDKIDTEDDGRIFVAAKSHEAVQKAIDTINAIVRMPEPGSIFSGKVTRIMTFGCFVEIAPEKEGLIHISKLAQERVNQIEDVVNIGDVVTVMVSEIDDQGRINLSRRACLPGADYPDFDKDTARPPRRPSGNRSDRGDRGDRGDRIGRSDRDRRPPRRES